MVKYLNLKRIILEGLLLIILLLLGWEWLKALTFFTDTEKDSLWMFFVPFSVLLILYTFIPQWWVKLVVSLSFLIYWYHFTLWDGSFFSKDWILASYAVLKEYGLEIIRMNWNWEGIDPILRTGIFYLFVWVSVHLLHFQVMIKRKVLGILFGSIIYLALLDTFLLFDGKLPLIKSLALGFAMLAIVNLNKVEKVTRRGITQMKLLPWMIVSIAIVLVFTTIGFYAPKAAEPSWPDPVAFLQAMKDGNGVGGIGIAQSGYSKDDRRLGGSFTQKLDPVFISEVKGDRYPAHYWRGESKEIYTGKGWVEASEQYQPLMLNTPMPFPLINSKDKSVINETITYIDSDSLIFVGGQPEQILSLRYYKSAQQNISLKFSNNYRVESDSQLKGYQLQSSIPIISENELMKISEKYSHSTNNYPEYYTRVYTQLPESLPERVRLLGKDIVADETNIYKKVKAVENFLRWGKFSYQISNIPFPKEDQDFVDQFLFESNQGYCDHFSTAMVVLLRTQGIPARWVKGYTFGDFRSVDAGTHTVTVREKDAHSWVEVYFPEVGWVPFEPTTSFSLPYSIERDKLEGQSVLAQVNKAQERLDEIKRRNEELLMLKEKEQNDIGSGGSSNNGWGKWILFSLVILLVGGLLYYYRGPIWFRMEALSVVKDSGSKLIYRTYRLTLKWFGKLFTPRAESQTVREYSASLYLQEEKADMVQLTKAFEETRYGEKPPRLSKKEFLSLWKNLLKRIRS